MKTTKELARELGLLRRRTIGASREAKTKNDLCGQSFKYLIVIDFESTCWKEGKFRTQEIIEFPAVLLNTVSGEVESEFHHYVQPQEQPVLSGFCTELTGITQDKVDNGIPLNLCLRKFQHWLRKLHTDMGVVCTGSSIVQTKQGTSDYNTTCVTWSDWDLGVCLQYECKRKQLLKPSELTSWIDLRATYRKFYQRRPNGLNGALQDVGINFEGREHSGVDDARNTAKLAYRLMKDGCDLKVTKSIKNHERSSSCNPSIDTYFKTNSNSTSCQPGTSKTGANQQPGISKTGANQQPGISKTGINQQHKGLVSPTLTVRCQGTPSKIPRPIPKPELCCAKTSDAEMEKNPEKCDSVRNDDERLCINIHQRKGTLENCTSSTPVKPKLSCKRKDVTPLKLVHSNGVMNSPCRKMARKFTPKKISGKDIYVDGNTDNSGVGLKDTINKPGLKEHISNIPDLNKQNKPSATSISKMSVDNNIEKAKAVFKKPSPVSRQSGTCIKVDTVHRTQENCRYKNLSTSTPINSNIGQNNFTNKDAISPILPSSHSSGKLNSNSKVYNTASLSHFKTPSSSIPTSTPFSSGHSLKTPNFTSSGHSLKTPNFTSSGHSTLKTPNFTGSSCQSTFLNGSNSSMKMTPPLCRCGRRSKRKMVQSPGQNMGRFFFSCVVRKGAWSKEGCDFFKWEVTSSTPRGSSTHGSRPVFNTRTPDCTNNSQRRNLGVKSAFKTPVMICR